jgi:hypothetical protein
MSSNPRFHLGVKRFCGGDVNKGTTLFGHKGLCKAALTRPRATGYQYRLSHRAMRKQKSSLMKRRENLAAFCIRIGPDPPRGDCCA